MLAHAFWGWRRRRPGTSYSSHSFPQIQFKAFFFTLSCSLHVNLRTHYYVPYDAIHGSSSPLSQPICAYVQRFTSPIGSSAHLTSPHRTIRQHMGLPNCWPTECSVIPSYTRKLRSQ